MEVGAENLSRIKNNAEDNDLLRLRASVYGRGAFYIQWRWIVKSAGVYGSEYAGMSSVQELWKSAPPNAQGFQSYVRRLWVNRYLRWDPTWGVADGWLVKIPVLD